MATNSRFAVAVHVLTLLAWDGDEPLKSEYVAESVNTNPVVIRRLLCDLARAGLVVSQKGSTGGTRLAKEPREIELVHVYRAVEGRGVFALHRQSPSQHCPVGVSIESILHGVFDDVNAAVERALSQITLEDIVHRLNSYSNGGKKHRSKG